MAGSGLCLPTFAWSEVNHEKTSGWPVCRPRTAPGTYRTRTKSARNWTAGFGPLIKRFVFLEWMKIWLAFHYEHNTFDLRAKAVPLHTMEGLGGRGGIAILDLGTRRGWVVRVTTRPRFSPGERTPVPIGQEAGWAPEPVWTQRLEEKSFCLCRVSNLDRRVVQSVARHYTDWATRFTLAFDLCCTITEKKGNTICGLFASEERHRMHAWTATQTIVVVTWRRTGWLRDVWSNSLMAEHQFVIWLASAQTTFTVEIL
jgi:hypothetical protein